jgi:phosphoserine phosphatase RsbU/P
VVTSFYASTNSLALCNAGHPPPLLYRAATQKWEYLYQDYPQAESIVNIPLGIDGISNYQQIHVELEVGDLVLCYTDSLPEARNAAGEFLGQDGLLEVLNSLEDTQPAKLIENLLGAIALRQDGNLASDDITLLLFRPNGLSKRPSLGKRLLAPIRLGGAILRRLGHPERPIPWPQMSVPNVGGIFSNALGARKILRSKGASSRTTVPS